MSNCFPLKLCLFCKSVHKRTIILMPKKSDDSLTGVAICAANSGQLYGIHQFNAMAFITRLVIALGTIFVVESSDARARLGEFLFKDYSDKLLPLKTKRLMNIFLSANLYQLLEVNAKDQYLLLSIWMTETWSDDNLFWEPGDFDGIDQLHIPAQYIWKPDTYPQNNIEINPAETERRMMVVLYPKMATSPIYVNTSKVIMAFPAIYKLSCPMNIKFFPWDHHTCAMPFTSWSFDQSQLDFTTSNESASSRSYIRSQEYDLVNFTAKTDVHCYMKEHPSKGLIERCWSYANFTIEIKRKPLFYIFNLVVPSFVLTIICFMGLFSLSSSTGERTEKVSLGITTMLALSIILLVIGDQMPKTSVLIPIIGWYFLTLMLLIACALVATVFVVHLHQKWQTSTNVSTSSANHQKVNNEFANNSDHQETKNCNSVSINEPSLQQIYHEIVAARHAVQKMRRKDEEREKQEKKLEEWESRISVLEKVLFLLFSSFACIATGTFVLVGSNCGKNCK